MAFIVDDRVRETTTIVGTGPVTTLGPPNGFQTFGNVMSVGDTTWYAIVQPGGNWETGKVRVDDQLEFVDCSSLDEDIHAIQWYGTVGEVEYKTDFVNNICRPNERITDIAPYQHMMELWTIEAKKPAPTTAVPTTAVPTTVVPTAEPVTNDADKKIKCPYTGFTKTCLDGVVKHNCPKWIHIVGANPNTGESIDKYGCSDQWIPLLLIENLQQQRQTGASVDSVRNEMLRLNSRPVPLLIAN